MRNKPSFSQRVSTFFNTVFRKNWLVTLLSVVCAVLCVLLVSMA